MNILFLTQSKTLSLFYDLMQNLREKVEIGKVGFYVADSSFYNWFKRMNPEISSGCFEILKEWDIIAKSQNIVPDIQLLGEYEKKYGDPFFWNALVADRRIFFGKKYAYAQDYRPRYSHEQMLAILQTGLQRMEDFFNRVQPDFVVSFQCVTLGEYLSYLFARARNIPVLNLRPMRIRNYFYAGESVLEPSERLEKTYMEFFENGIEDDLKKEAVAYIREVQKTHAMYEGVVPPSGKPPVTTSSGRKRSSLLKIKSLIGLLEGEYKYRFGEYKYDNHVSGYVGPFIAQKVVRPWRARLMEHIFNSVYIRAEDLSRMNYAFFPLHTEPEVTLSVYSKPYLNQIEAVRLFSHNLPVGMKLLVKEHPWAIGKRHISYYRKLLEIPNVMLAHPSLKSRELVSNARIITVISGSIGLEGLIIKKPVVVLGRAPFNFLPDSMIRYVKNPDSLGEEIRSLMENYEYNEKAILTYIAAVIKESVPVDYYTKLLGRKGAYNPDGMGSAEEQRQQRVEHIKRLAQYLAKRYYDLSNVDNINIANSA